MNEKFITYFPNCKFRYLDLADNGKPPVSSDTQKNELNEQGYDSFFTPNGFEGIDATKENCSNLNAFYVDIDEKLSDEEIEKIKSKFNPTFIVKTMQGFHIYWLLDEPIFKTEITLEEWDKEVARWEKIEQAIVREFKGDPAVKDIPRILRVPNTIYFKKTDGTFKTKGLYKNTSSVYSMREIEEIVDVETLPATLDGEIDTITEKTKKLANAERSNFFERVNDEYPIEERDSFKALISGSLNSLHPDFGRNTHLHVTASLMKQAGWTLEKAFEHFKKIGWYELGDREIISTIKSAFEKGYTYAYKKEVIAFNMSPEENQKIQQTYTKVGKDRKEQDKLRFSNYERELIVKFPNLRKNEIGIIYQYRDGVYVIMSDQEVSDTILISLYDDMLWGYRTKRNVSDKLACLISIIPLLEISDDKGYIANVKNGLLNIYTKELSPHRPDFVSLIQYPVNYDPNAKAPLWGKCVGEWMDGDEKEDKIRLLQQFCGYCLSSSMLYDRALFMVGDGGNGKSTFIDTIAMVIGPESTSHIDLEGLYGTFGMHGLIGKRLNIIEEVAGNYYQSNKLKKLISGEKVTIDIKYKAQFTFRPQAKFVFSVNTFPRVDDTSTATERRICAVQFLNNYRDNPNYNLRSSIGLLAKELPGIFNWMIEGAKDLAENDEFIVTNEQIKMLDEYREENSSVEGFLSQCIILDPGSEIEATDLYSDYKKWSSTDGGRKTKANITFTKEVKAYGAKDNRFTYIPRDSSGAEAKFVGIAASPQWLAQCAKDESSNLNNNHRDPHY